MEYYSAIESNEALIHAVTWMTHKNIVLRERRQTQKPTYCMIPLVGNVQNRQIQRDRRQIHGCQGLGEGDRE